MQTACLILTALCLQPQRSKTKQLVEQPDSEIRFIVRADMKPAWLQLEARLGDWVTKLREPTLAAPNDAPIYRYFLLFAQ